MPSSSPLRRGQHAVGAGCAVLALVGLLVDPARLIAQEPRAPESVSAERLQGAIDALGNLDYQTRTDASRLVRRTAPASAVPALIEAVERHRDGYVRYRALVLLTGFNDSRTPTVMRDVLVSPNDRLRTVSYRFFEREPDPSLATLFLNALDRELSEFVRPALIGALSAMGTAPAVRPVLVREVGRGEDFFRSVVIEALGIHKAQYAFDAITNVAKLDGPLQDDAALALGRIGGPQAITTLRDLQGAASPAVQPSIAAGLCLLGSDCEGRERFLRETLVYADRNPGFQEILRGAAAGLSALAVGDRLTAAGTLFEVGIPSKDPTRAPVALGLATVALRNTPLMLSILASHPKQPEAIELLAEGFDMLEEDLEKERFFAMVRRTYWAAPEGSATRALAQLLIGKLDF